MAAIPKPDKEAIRAWLRGRRQSTEPPPSIEQIKAELFSNEAPSILLAGDARTAERRESVETVSS